MTSQVTLIKNRVNPFYINNDDIVDGEVETYADLPASANLNDVYLVKTTTGIIGNRKLAGFYVYRVSGWVAMPVAMIASNVFYDNTTSGMTSNTVKGAIDELSANNLHITSASFNTSDGVLTLTLNDTSTLTVDLDGRFLQNVVEDTTPQLGGNLDLNSNDITGTGDIDITGEVTATTLIGNMRGATIFKAKAGEALTKGDPVYISGDDLTGNQPVVSIADSDDANKMPCFGLAAETVSLNANVDVVTFGTLSGLDTSSFNQGDILYISTTGTLTATKPAGESSLIQNIGKVMRSHASAGSIKVGGAGRTNDVPNLNDGNVFIGNASNQAETRGLTLDDIAATTTNKHFTASDETKLDGIETGADVTDSTNVDAAGAVMNSDTSTASMGFVIDEDTMASNSETKVPTQQSVKAYVDANSIDPRDSFTQNASQYIATEEIRARNVDGLKLNDDGGNGIFIKDGGNVGVGTTDPIKKVHCGGDIAIDANIFHSGTNAYTDRPAIRFYGHSGGNSMYIGGGATTVIGAGEFAYNFYYADPDRVTESVFIGADSNIRMFVNSQTFADRIEALRIFSNGNVTIYEDLTVDGAVSKGSGSFDIAHPDPKKKDTHRLRHYFVETPSAGGNIYKYQLECNEGENYIDLPDYFEHLNKDSLVWVNPFKHFGRAWGEVIDGGKRAKIVVEQSGIYNILIFGDRKDAIAMQEFEKYGIEYQNKE